MGKVLVHCTAVLVRWIQVVSYAELCILGVSICHEITAFPCKATADELQQT